MTPGNKASTVDPRALLGKSALGSRLIKHETGFIVNV